MGSSLKRWEIMIVYANLKLNSIITNNKMSISNTTDPSELIPQSRNIANSAHVKIAIERRAHERNDTSSVARWLKKQFTRYVLRVFSEVKVITSVSEYEVLAMESAPAWLSIRFGEPDVIICWMDPQEPTLLDLERKVLEWLYSRLGTRDEAKFPRITPEQVLNKWQADHLVMSRAMKRGWLPTSGSGRIKIAEINDFVIWEFDPTHPEFRQELANESAMMQHCIGQFSDREKMEGGYGMYYVDKAINRTMRLFSIRNLAGTAHVTASVNVSDDCLLTLEQLKGKQNQPPASKYITASVELLRVLNIKHYQHFDTESAGIYERGGDTVTFDKLPLDEQRQIITRYPALFAQMKSYDPQSWWIVGETGFDAFSDKVTIPTGFQIFAALLNPISVLKAKIPGLNKTARNGASFEVEGIKVRIPSCQNLRRLK